MWWSTLLCCGLFVALLVGFELGTRLGRKSLSTDPDGGGYAAADGVVFAVLGLLIAFTLSASASRFDERRRLIVQQANALGTANLRLDMLEHTDRAAIRLRMKQWIDKSHELVRLQRGDPTVKAALAEAEAIQLDVWRLTNDALSRKQQPPLVPFVMAPLNEWIDLSTTRYALQHMGLPPIVVPTLVTFSIVGSILAGCTMARLKKGRMLHVFAFAVAVSFSIYVILDLNEPRMGLITLTSMDEAMMQVRSGLEQQLTADQGK